MKKPYSLPFLHGFILASLLYFKMQSSYEDSVFASIRTNIDHNIDRDDTRDSIVVKAMNVCHNLMSNRAPVFVGNSIQLQDNYFHSVSVDLMTTSGACGSYAMVLSRVLEDLHFPVRIAQMKVKGIYGGHNIVEVKTGQSWVVLDPTFDVSFTRPDARLASFADVQHDWNYYSRQVPAGYNPTYRYEDVRYTNWSKIPVLFPTLKVLLNATLGQEKTNHISIRTWFLKIYDVCFYGVLLIYLPVLFFALKRRVRTRLFPNQDISLTLTAS